MANFKASARSVDMLGRQQIAGIPNAINEIFKNAYDAYAKEVRVDYLENDNILFIRDNGYGMTRDDFENKWLTLGTDSKTVEGNLYVPKDNIRRHVLGEKGIGRLSIATIGSSVLVVTRANRNDVVSKIITSFICWSLFEIPGISIDKIPVPVAESDSMPDEKSVANLKQEILDFYTEIKDSGKYTISSELDKKIISSLNFQPFSPKQLSHQYCDTDIKDYSSSLYLDDNLNGTHFYISPVDSILSALLAKNSLYKRDLNDLTKQLLGFYPSFLPDEKQEMLTSFYIYRKDELIPENIISQNEFFSKDEYKKADHHFEGAFDKNGTFTGEVSIYGKKFNFTQVWQNSKGRIPKCGAFKIRIGFFQGKEDESSLSANDFSFMKAKLDRLGGLYIYKENVRVLPYGDNDFDFLKLEKLRTLSAAYYMFSLRRFIGAILLNNEDNIALQEKAGREGFSKNQAYYDFISILQDFFDSILSNFLREKSNKRVSDVYLETKADLVKQHSIQKLEDEKIKKAQEDFERALKQYNSLLEKQKSDKEFQLLLKEIDNCISYTDLLEEAKDKIQKLETLKGRLIEYVRKTESLLDLIPPQKSLGEELHLRFVRYQSECSAYFDTELYPNRDSYLKKIEFELLEIGDKLEQDKKFQQRINSYLEEISVLLNTHSEKISKQVHCFPESIQTWKDAFYNQFSAKIEGILQDVKRPIRSSNEVVEAINNCEKLIKNTKKSINQFYSSICSDIDSTEKLDPLNMNSYSNQEALVAQGESLLDLRKQLDNEFELFQLGTAISIIHHEFGSTADSLKHAIADLSVWANANKALRPLYNQLSTSYAHLENYLKLFTPLSRRTASVKTDIYGKEIYKYIMSLFGERCQKDFVSITQSKSFETGVISIDASVILPVFINLVDNALFWVKSNTVDEGRKILFDIDESKHLIISDNGPGFQELSEDLIFSRGFTTKPGGRGLGLYIARQILNDCGFEIEATKSQLGKGAGFIIYEKEKIEE